MFAVPLAALPPAGLAGLESLSLQSGPEVFGVVLFYLRLEQKVKGCPMRKSQVVQVTDRHSLSIGGCRSAVADRRSALRSLISWCRSNDSNSRNIDFGYVRPGPAGRNIGVNVASTRYDPT